MEELKISTEGHVVLPQPDEISKREKDDAMGAYLMMFASLGIGLPLPLLSLIAAVIYFFINKKQSRFVAFHSFQSLITQTPVSLLNAGLVIWIFYIFFSAFSRTYENGIPNIFFPDTFFYYLWFVLFWNLVYIIFSLIACVKARKGQFYYFILFGRISYNMYYGKWAQKKVNKIIENKPPSGY